MSLLGTLSNCGIKNRSECVEREYSQQMLQDSQHPNRMKQLILENKRKNILVSNETSGNYDLNNQKRYNLINDRNNEIIPNFQEAQFSSHESSSEDEEDYSKMVEENNGYLSSVSSSHSLDSQQIIKEFVSLPIKNQKKRRDLLYGSGQGGNDNQSYKASMRSRNSSQNPSQDGGSQTRLEKQSKRSTKAWTEEEDRLLRFYYSKHNGKWPAIANEMADRNASQCSQRWRKIKPSKIRRPWTPEEDSMVLVLIKQHGKNWGLISSQMDNRSGKQVRERYINKLDPDLNNNQFNEEEDRIIIDKYYKIGPKWSEIAKYLTGRSENMVKNRFYSYIKKTYAINSLQGTKNSDTSSWYDSSSRKQDDNASSYASSQYSDLDPSINSGNIESEESSSEGEYNQFSLGPNPGQTLGLVDDKKSYNNQNKQFQEDIFKPQVDNQINFDQQGQGQQLFTNVPVQLQGNLYIQNQQQQHQMQNQQQYYVFNQQENQQGGMGQNKFGLNPNTSSQDFLKINSNYKEKAEEMFHTPRLALANNSSFFPQDMFIQQQRFQNEDMMNSNGQQQLGNNFFNASPSPLILLSPAPIKNEQFSLTSNTPSRRFMFSSQNTPYTNNPASNQNINNQNSNVHFNFSNIASTPNYKVPNSQQQQQPQYQNPHQQQYVQQQQYTQQQQQPPHFNQNYIQNQHPQYQQHQQQIEQTGLNQGIFNFQNNQQVANSNQQSITNIKVNAEETLDSLNYNSNSTAQTPTQGLQGTYFLPPISPNQNILNDYQQQMFLQTTGEQQQQQAYYSQQNINNNNKNLQQNSQQNPREELRLDVSCTDGQKQEQQQLQQGGYNNQQMPLATPKIDRKQLKNMIVDLESQLQLLKVQQNVMLDEDDEQ